MNRLTIPTLAIIILAAAAFGCCGDWQRLTPTPTPGAEPRTTTTPGPTTVPTPEETPGTTPTVDPQASRYEAETLAALAEAEIPMRDLRELAIRLQGVPADAPLIVNPTSSPNYPIGTRRVFRVSNHDTNENFEITAVLVYKTDHVYMWVEEGERFDQEDVEAAAELFENHTYPTNRAFFGSEWTPGVDNDPHISILHATGLGGVGGYYSSADEYTTAIRPDSNEMELFVISLDYEVINSEEYNGVLAHEFQHMIHWYHDRNEDTWMNEGFSELASYLNGFDPGSHWYFYGTPDIQLNNLDYDSPDSIAGYGGSYLFAAYFLDRFGAEATQALVNCPENGMEAVDAVLEELGTGLTHEDLFADWIIANLLDDPSLAEGQYGYKDLDIHSIEIEDTYFSDDYPASRNTNVHQYGTDYIELHADRPLVFRFSGAPQTRLFPTDAHSGRYTWYSNRGDDSDMTLTRAFDLSDVSQATLDFWMWYNIEEDWDYAYVEVSTDGGQTWTILTTPSGTDYNPVGNSFGWGYTGDSGDSSPHWVHEQVDLSAYAGQEVLVRFEYITDDALNRFGLVLDDIAIPEIGYFSDLETDGGGWEPAGFVRTANILRQRWLVQLVLFGPETTVQRLQVNADGSGEWIIPLGGDTRQATITVTALAPVTTVRAPYSFEVDVQ